MNLSPRPPGRVEAVLVTYDSGVEVIGSCEAVLAEADGLIVVDNGSPASFLAELGAALEGYGPRAQIIANRGNVGLAAAQNQGIEAASARGADWVLLLDDDSLPRPGLRTAFAAALAAARRPEQVGLIAPAIRQPEEAGETRYWTMRGRWRVARRRLGKAVEDAAIFVIASGSLVRTSALKSIGGMREDFFIDYVDVEFGLRLREAEWHILVVPGAVLEHRLGIPTRHGFGPLSFKSTNHEAGRRFTIFRNRMRLWRHYAGILPGWVVADAAAALTDLLRILCFESGKRAKVGRALAGMWQGWRAPPLERPSRVSSPRNRSTSE